MCILFQSIIYLFGKEEDDIRKNDGKMPEKEQYKKLDPVLVRKIKKKEIGHFLYICICCFCIII